MTTPHAALVALVASWRSQARYSNQNTRIGYERCANELAAALAQPGAGESAVMRDGVDVYRDDVAGCWIGSYKVLSAGQTADEAVAATKSAIRLIAATGWCQSAGRPTREPEPPSSEPGDVEALAVAIMSDWLRFAHEGVITMPVDAAVQSIREALRRVQAGDRPTQASDQCSLEDDCQCPACARERAITAGGTLKLTRYGRLAYEAGRASTASPASAPTREQDALAALNWLLHLAHGCGRGGDGVGDGEIEAACEEAQRVLALYAPAVSAGETDQEPKP